MFGCLLFAYIHKNVRLTTKRGQVSYRTTEKEKLK